MKRIGIDLGGSSVKGGVVEDGIILCSASYRTRFAKNREDILDAIYKTIDSLLGKEKDIERIGLVSAGNIDPDSGVCLYSQNLKGWSNTPIKSLLENRYRLPTFVENDALGALYGELSYYKNYRNVTMLTFGTGVGSASLVNGKVDRSERVSWGERIIRVGDKGLPAERLLSTAALKKYVYSLYGFPVKTKEIMMRAKRGEAKANRALNQYGAALNALLALVREETSPELIILGGGLMNAQDVMKKRIDPEYKECVFAHYGNDAGIIGASLLPLDA